MCGLAGIIDTAAREVRADVVADALGALSHRGPDAQHVWRDGPCTLLHCRLRILDVGERADQPMHTTRGGRLAMVYNGEVYNYRALRDDLTREGWAFSTTTDAEVLLAGFRAWGPAVFRRARGMWAAAFWEPDLKRLTLSRDPLGKKPLLYGRSSGQLAFASTIPALLRLIESTPSVDPEALDCYLGHLVVPQEHTMFAGISRVPPGCTVSWTMGGEPVVERYWSIPSVADDARRTQDTELELEQLLRQAVRRRLESDVPLGVFLSSGYDSGLVAALAAQESGKRLVAVTAGTMGSGYDERSNAAMVARQYGLDHRPLEVPPISAEVLPQLIGELGEPFGDSSLLPSYAVARAARRDITVALTGDGGDEGFFGYEMFRGVQYASWYRAVVPGPARRLLWAVTKGASADTFARKLGALSEYGRAPLAASFRNRMGFDSGQRRRLVKGPWRTDGHSAEHIYHHRLIELARLPDPDALRRTLYETYLPNDYLTKVDTATMASSLEARCPFLDLDLVEFVLRLPAQTAFSHLHHKVLLRPLVRRLLPPALLKQRKAGFGVPVARWMRGPLQNAFHEFVLRPGSLISEMLDLGEVRRVFEAHQHGADHSTRLWGLLALGVWCAVTVEHRWNSAAPLPVDS